jgi:pilus assembly protein CpaB
MRLRKIFCLALALASAGGAYVIQRKRIVTNTPSVILVAPESTDILVASADFPSGRILSSSDVRWQPWPKTMLNAAMIVGSPAGNDALQNVIGKRMKTQVAAGEPIRVDRIEKAGSGFLASLLRPGYRAVSIAIDSQGSTTAGGFILPNDRVDVVSTSQTGTKYNSDLILTNVRVLAIGKAVESGTDRMVSGTTATLEVTPQQTELLATGQRTGQLSLALRASGENSRDDAGDAKALRTPIATVAVSRNGVRQEYSVPGINQSHPANTGTFADIR